MPAKPSVWRWRGCLPRYCKTRSRSWQRPRKKPKRLTPPALRQRRRKLKPNYRKPEWTETKTRRLLWIGRMHGWTWRGSQERHKTYRGFYADERGLKISANLAIGQAAATCPIFLLRGILRYGCSISAPRSRTGHCRSKHKLLSVCATIARSGGPNGAA